MVKALVKVSLSLVEISPNVFVNIFAQNKGKHWLNYPIIATISQA